MAPWEPGVSFTWLCLMFSHLRLFFADSFSLRLYDVTVSLQCASLGCMLISSDVRLSLALIFLWTASPMVCESVGQTELRVISVESMQVSENIANTRWAQSHNWTHFKFLISQADMSEMVCNIQCMQKMALHSLFRCFELSVYGKQISLQARPRCYILLVRPTIKDFSSCFCWNWPE